MVPFPSPNFSPKHSPTSAQLNPPHDCFIDLAVSNDFPARWIHACRAQDAGFYGQVMGTQASQKKYCSGLVPVRTLSPALSTATLRMCSADFQHQQHTPSKRLGDHYIRNNKTDSRAASCFAKKSRVETTRCRNLRAGWEKALQCRQSNAMGIAVRTLRRTDAVCHYTFLCNPTKQCFTEITTAKTSSEI